MWLGIWTQVKHKLANAEPCESSHSWLLLWVFLFDDVLLSMTRQMQRGTRVTVVGVCRLIACILHNFNLTDVLLDHRPRDCADNDAWRREGLPALPKRLDPNPGLYNTKESWTEVLGWLREHAFAVGLPTPRLRATAETFPTHHRVARFTHSSAFLRTLNLSGIS